MGRALLLGLLCFASTEAFAADWKQIEGKDGITVWQREVPGTSLVEFRGRGDVNVHVKNILAVLHDNDRKTEWMNRCVENRLVRTKGLGFSVIYYRIGSSYPLVDDRDIVVETALSFDKKTRTVEIDIKDVVDASVPPVEGVVRMPSVISRWTLVAKDTTVTEVTYQVKADPGGLLPNWIVNLVSKDMPFKTIAALREQVKKSGYEKNLAIVEGAFDWDGAEKEARGALQAKSRSATTAGF